MPELPEVETIARGVHERLCGDRIIQAWFSSHREPFKTPPGRQSKGLERRVFLAVHRTGKHIVCELGRAADGELSHPSLLVECDQKPSAQWIVHLGMTGRLLVTSPDGPVATHTHARLSLGSGREIRFVDARRFGRLEFRELRKAERFSAAGDEPMTIGTAEFAEL